MDYQLRVDLRDSDWEQDLEGVDWTQYRLVYSIANSAVFAFCSYPYVLLGNLTQYRYAYLVHKEKLHDWLAVDTLAHKLYKDTEGAV